MAVQSGQVLIYISCHSQMIWGVPCIVLADEAGSRHQLGHVGIQQICLHIPSGERKFLQAWGLLSRGDMLLFAHMDLSVGNVKLASYPPECENSWKDTPKAYHKGMDDELGWNFLAHTLN